MTSEVFCVGSGPPGGGGGTTRGPAMVESYLATTVCRLGAQSACTGIPPPFRRPNVHGKQHGNTDHVTMAVAKIEFPVLFYAPRPLRALPLR